MSLTSAALVEKMHSYIGGDLELSEVLDETQIRGPVKYAPRGFAVIDFQNPQGTEITVPVSMVAPSLLTRCSHCHFFSACRFLV